MLVFDLETNGLLNDVTCVHCLVIYDSEADQVLVFNDQGSEEPIVRGVQLLEEADVLCGHNVISYDIPVLVTLSVRNHVCHYNFMAVILWSHMGIVFVNIKASSVRHLTGKNGHKKCRTTAYKM